MRYNWLHFHAKAYLKKGGKKIPAFYVPKEALFFCSFSLNNAIPSPLVCSGCTSTGCTTQLPRSEGNSRPRTASLRFSPWALPDLIRNHSASLWQLLKKIIMTWPLSSFRWKSSRKWQETEVIRELIKQPLARGERKAASRRGRYNSFDWKMRQK